MTDPKSIPADLRALAEECKRLADNAAQVHRFAERKAARDAAIDRLLAAAEAAQRDAGRLEPLTGKPVLVSGPGASLVVHEVPLTDAGRELLTSTAKSIPAAQPSGCDGLRGDERANLNGIIERQRNELALLNARLHDARETPLALQIDGLRYTMPPNMEERAFNAGFTAAKKAARNLAIADAEAGAPKAGEAAPVDMVLYCPKCGMQHVDAPEIGYSGIVPGPYQAHTDWSNPPHRSHLCHACGHIWRPADVPTNGVAAIKTKGANDSALSHPAPEPSGEVQRLRDALEQIAAAHDSELMAAIAREAIALPLYARGLTQAEHDALNRATFRSARFIPDALAQSGAQGAVPAGLTDERIREGFRGYDMSIGAKGQTSWQLWRDAVSWAWVVAKSSAQAAEPVAPKSIQDLQREIGYLQQELILRVCGDPRQSVSFCTAPPPPSSTPAEGADHAK